MKARGLTRDQVINDVLLRCAADQAVRHLRTGRGARGVPLLGQRRADHRRQSTRSTAAGPPNKRRSSPILPLRKVRTRDTPSGARSHENRRHQVRNASAMPLTNPSYPKGPYRFYNREYLIVTYRTDPDALRAVVPEPLEIAEPIVKYEFIRMPDSTGFGDYTESGQVIPVTLQRREGHLRPFDVSRRRIADRRRPRNLGLSQEVRHAETVRTRHEVLVGTLHYGSILCAVAHHGLQAQDPAAGADPALDGRAELPHQDHSACRQFAARLRTGALQSAGRRTEGRLGRTGGAANCSSMSWPTSRSCRCWKFWAARISSPI